MGLFAFVNNETDPFTAISTVVGMLRMMKHYTLPLKTNEPTT